jgi:hypothetical protein
MWMCEAEIRKKERTTDLVIQAIKSGFRGIDTACQPKVGHVHQMDDMSNDSSR